MWQSGEGGKKILLELRRGGTKRQRSPNQFFANSANLPKMQTSYAGRKNILLELW